MREVVVLRLAGLSYEETAETLGVGLNTVRSQINAATKRLRRILSASFPELGGGAGC
jgi:DNA-directed RNA polymerase specialized sigma24 family protein